MDISGFGKGLFIDGEWVDATGGTLDVINPATGAVVTTVGQASVADAQRAIAAARRAFDKGPWPRMSASERAAVLHRMGEILRRRAADLVELNVLEAGSIKWQAQAIHVDFPTTVWLDTADRLLPQFRFEEAMLPFDQGGLSQGVVVREPMGVATLITAYNFPTMLNLVKLAPALASGCTVVLKPSPYTPLEALILGEIADEAGLPPGVLNIVTGEIEVGTELTTNRMVDMVSFTGSDVVGRQIYAQSSQTLKKVVLELGGKSANIICADADLDKVMPDVVFHFTVQAGQGCSLATRALVHESIHDEVVARAKAALGAIKVGDPAQSDAMMGPLIREAQRGKVESLIRAGIDEGAQLVCGGGRPDVAGDGFYVEPTLFTGVDNASTIATTEFFGPVGVVIPFRTEEEAIELANASDYGLGGGVWTADPARGYQIARQLRTGMVTINGVGAFNLDATFGGYKNSGLGRERGAASISEYLEHKSITWGIA